MPNFVHQLFIATTTICGIDSIAQICSIFYYVKTRSQLIVFTTLQFGRFFGGVLMVYQYSRKAPGFTFLLLYWIYLLVMLFVIGNIVSYKECVWSLDFQIINQYVAMIFLLYTAEESLNQCPHSRKSPSENNDKSPPIELNFSKSFSRHPSWKLEIGKWKSFKIKKSYSSSPLSKCSKKSLDTLSIFTRKGLSQKSTESINLSIDVSERPKVTTLSENQLVIATFVLLPLTFGLSYQLQVSAHEWTPRQLMYLRFPGELFLRTINALMVPLIVTSLAYACTSIDLVNASDILYSITIYFIGTTLLASFVGVSTVLLLGPHPPPKSFAAITNSTPSLSVTDICMDTMRNFFTDSLPEALTGSYHTVLVPPKLNDTHSSIPLEEWEITHKKIATPNVSGLILFAMAVGLLAGRLGEHGRPIADFIYALNTILMLIIVTISYCAPIGMFFIVIPQIINTPVAILFRDVLWFSMIVILGLTIHVFIILSGIFLLLTGKDPFKFLANFPSTVSKAFGTDCSSVALADAMVTLERMGYNKEVIGFCIPLGSTLNMDGTALYQSITTIFLAHFLGIPLSTSKLISIFFSSSMISVGVAGMPQASLISIIIVLDTIGLKLENAALVLMVDAILDRFRTIANVFSNVFGAVIVSHLFRNDDNSGKTMGDSQHLDSHQKTESALEKIKAQSRRPNLRKILSVEKNEVSRCLKKVFIHDRSSDK